MRLKQRACEIKASLSYFALNAQNAFINVLTNYVKEPLVVIRKKHFGIIFNSTKTSHTDQMSDVIIYARNYSRES